VIVGETLKGEAELVQVTHTLDPTRSRFGFTQGGEEESRQDGNNGNDNKQFEQCESGLERPTTVAEPNARHT
jgi:hypothetical protein